MFVLSLKKKATKQSVQKIFLFLKLNPTYYHFVTILLYLRRQDGIEVDQLPVSKHRERAAPDIA